MSYKLIEGTLPELVFNIFEKDHKNFIEVCRGETQLCLGLFDFKWII